MLSSLRTRVGAIPGPRVDVLFIFLLVIFSLPMIVLIPPGAGYDEEDHLVRVWELSAFSFIPGRLPPQELKYPTVFRDFAYRQQGSSGILTSEYWHEYRGAALFERGFVHRQLETKSVYSPVLLLPQAISMRLFGRLLGMPALTVFYLCRFTSLLSYLVLVWLAIRLIPFSKWILLILALIPMALFQATTISPDAISNGIGFLFIAGCLRIHEFKEIRWRQVGILIFLVSLLFLSKLNLIPLVLLPFLLIPPSRFVEKRSYVVLLAMTVALFVVEVTGWNRIAAAHSNSLLANDANPKAQLLYILGHPFFFILTLFQDLLKNGSMYFQSWMNGYGYYYWTPPAIVSFLFLVSLILVLLADSTRERVDRKLSIAFVLVFLAAYLATVISLYLTFTPVGSDQILGVQGRYFVPLALLLSLPLSGLIQRINVAPFSTAWIVSLLTIALFLNSLGIFFSFHVLCGPTFYQTGLCYRPLYRDFTKTRLSAPISKQTSITQEIKAKCEGLTEVRVLLNPSVSEDQGTTLFTLQEAGSGQPLMDTSLSNDQISAEDWYSLRFPPDWHSKGKQYILHISSPNTASGQGVRLLYTTQSEFNFGNLYENQQPLPEDIVLQYGCVAGLRKIWLTGKP